MLFETFYRNNEQNKGPTTAQSQQEMWGIRDLSYRKKKNKVAELLTADDKINGYRTKVLEDCAPIISALGKSYTCAFCNTNYRGFDNFGTWQCTKRMHCGQWSLNSNWNCCGSEDRYSVGCKRCDHSSDIPEFGNPRWPEDRIFTEIPLWIMNKFPTMTSRYSVVDLEVAKNPMLIKARIQRVEL